MNDLALILRAKLTAAEQERERLRGWFVQQETRELIWTSQIDLADEPVMPLDKWLRLQRTDSSKET